MGIPVVLPSSPTIRSFSNHSAKPSWSNGSLSSSSSSSPSPSTSSYSSYPSSSRHHRLLQDTRPPLSTLAYVPPPSVPWGAGASPVSQYNSISPSEPTSNTALVSSLPPLLPSHLYTSATGAVFLSTLTTSPPPSLPSIASGLELFESPPPRSTTATPSRVRAPPNLRRISRVPVFVTAPSTLTVAGPAQVSTAASSSLTTTTPPSSASSQSSYTPLGPPSQPPPQQIWHPSSPSLAYYLTRPLPPAPPPLAQPMVSEDNVRYDHNSNHQDQSDSSGWNTDSYTAAAAAAAAALVRGHHVTSSTTGTNVNNHQHDPDHHDNNNNNNNNNMHTTASLFRRSYSTMLQGDSAVLDHLTNGRYVNRDHPDNQSRPDLADLYSGHSNHHRHHYPQRNRHDLNRQQPYQQQFGSSVSYPETIYSRTRIDTGGEGDLEDAVDPEYESSLSASSSASSRLMDRRARMRPRERERDREREREAWSSSTSTSPTVPMVNTPDFLQGYVVDDDETTQASISLNSQSSYSLGSSGTVRRTGRTLIRADAIHPGVIHIYPENHAPIWMYGRPILSPSSPLSSSPSGDSLPSPPSSDTNTGSGGGSESESDDTQLLSIPSSHNDLAIAATDRELSPPWMLPRPPPSASASVSVSRRQLNRYAASPHE